MTFPHLREAVNVADLKERDALVRRRQKIREGVVLDLNAVQHWNRLHPDEPQLDALWFEQVLDHLDGKVPMPALPESSDA